MNKKSYYEMPSAELIIVRFEENIMSVGQPGGAGGDDKVVTDELDME